MANRSGGGPDWANMEKWMDGRFPFMTDKWRKQMGSGNTDWVEGYVQDVLKRTFKQRSGAPWSEDKEQADVSSRGELDYEFEVFETHSSVIVRVMIPEEVQVRNVRVYAGSMQVKLEQDPTRRKMFISLPTEVLASSVKASVKNRVLEIRCPKLEEAEMFQEVRVRYL